MISLKEVRASDPQTLAEISQTDMFHAADSNQVDTQLRATVVGLRNGSLVRTPPSNAAHKALWARSWEETTACQIETMMAVLRLDRWVSWAESAAQLAYLSLLSSLMVMVLWAPQTKATAYAVFTAIAAALTVSGICILIL